LKSIYNLAGTYWELDRQREAIILYERELEMCRRLYGAKDQHTMMSMANLVERYRDVDSLKLMSHN
jgi:Tetratricopeptide repeat